MSKTAEYYVEKFRAYLDTRQHFESLRADLEQAQGCCAPGLWERYQEQFMLDNWCYGKEARQLLLNYVTSGDSEKEALLSSLVQSRRLERYGGTRLEPLTDSYREVLIAELTVFRAHKEMLEELLPGNSPLEVAYPDDIQERLAEQVRRPGGRELHGRLLLSPIWQEMDWQEKLN